MAHEKPVCVTGAAGFVASWIICKLLDKGYTVHGTVRDLANNYAKCGHLKSLKGANERLTLFEADLLDFQSLIPAIRGCDGVFHTACPVAKVFENPDDVLLPAIQGTKNVLQACCQENVRHVVMTSSASAIIGSKRPKDKVIDESCWSDIHYCKENKQWYMLAKTEAEKLAWDFSKYHKLNLVVICPAFVLGPLLQPTLNASTDFLKRLIDGSKKSYPNSYTHVVDVRDTAEAHIAAFENPSAWGRYYCFGYVVHFKDMIQLFKKKFPQLPLAERPDASEISGNMRNASNKKLLTLMKDLIPLEQTLVDTVHSLQELGALCYASPQLKPKI